MLVRGQRARPVAVQVECSHADVAHSHGEPESEIERMVCEAWKEALGLPGVGFDQNFFDLGAHSLTVAEVQAKLQIALQRDISIVDLFELEASDTLCLLLLKLAELRHAQTDCFTETLLAEARVLPLDHQLAAEGQVVAHEDAVTRANTLLLE